MKKFILTTYNGTVPNYVDHLMKNPIIINMENIYYIDSYYYKGGTLTLNEFCSLDNDIYLKLNLPLKTYRGNLKISEEEYQNFLNRAKPKYYQKYGDVSGNYYDENGNEFIIKNPKSWKEMVSILNNYDFIDTDFLNKMVENGERIVDSNIVDTKYDCHCCGSKGYLNYLWNLGEISAKMIIARHNYKELVKYFESINGD